MWVFADAVSWSMFTLGVVLMTVILLRRAVRYSKGRRAGADSLGTTKAGAVRDFDREQPLMDAPPEILRWQVEMQEMARDLKAELDSKMRALQVLAKMASNESERLERAIARAERLGIAEHGDPLKEIERLADSALDDGPEQAGSLPAPADTGEGLPGKWAATRKTVYRLSDEGLDAAAIAQEAGLPIGEVEMILNLRPIPGPANRSP
jgi:hypothetical protein